MVRMTAWIIKEINNILLGASPRNGPFSTVEMSGAEMAIIKQVQAKCIRGIFILLSLQFFFLIKAESWYSTPG